MTNRHHTRLGEDGEKLAERFLVRTGMTVVERRHRTRRGEIDLVCRDGEMLVFVEVKTRRSERAGSPLESITPAKQRQLTRLALSYLKQHDLLECPARFDIVGILFEDDSETPRIDHYRDAFPAIGGESFF